MNTRSDRINAQEQRLLKQRWWMATLVCAGMLFIVLLLALTVLQFDVLPTILRNGPIWFLLPLSLWWLWLLRRQPARCLALWRDLRQQHVQPFSGIAHLQQRRAPGLFAPVHEELWLADWRFDLGHLADVPRCHQRQVNIRFSPHALCLLSVELSADTENDTTNWSVRERQILTLMAQGLSDKLIARKLALSPGTIRTYNTTIFRKLNVSDRNAAILAARSHHLLDVN